ncbi:hypothetical protein GL267_003305 [Acidithiobacillus ferrianus]|uniref:Uncharacterized protein n=2 Tax=Acidithiobacillus ferrianus TaxID=2678518 RepID=A0A845U8X8_9PROT|nr:hypothetical protein [Acidithiobacillus ferrianus]NDU43303.1 hypothetical protein [Acidithiobacillus ferrianus]
MDIEEFIRQDDSLETWEQACSYGFNTWFSLLLYHIWQDVDHVKVDSKGAPVSRSEKKALMLAIIDRLLSEGRIVFDDSYTDKFTIWHVDKGVILKCLDDEWPDMNDPDYDDKMIILFLDKIGLPGLILQEKRTKRGVLVRSGLMA